jgi:predicted aminopeptidase
MRPETARAEHRQSPGEPRVAGCDVASAKPVRRAPVPRGLAAALAAASLLGGAGCSTVDGLGYYAQSIGGHLAVLRAARPVTAVIADEATPAALRERLALSQRMRDFAVSELGLPDNASYRRYADVGRPSVVFNVAAAPELSLRLETWCFPVVGCVAYRGYYDRANADAYAAPLRERGLEVIVYGVPAYSTLGKLPLWWDWWADPLLNTFIAWPEGELARLIFHELAHQVAFAPDDTEFNESYATAVERLGGRLWLERHGAPGALEEYQRFDARRTEFKALTLATRARLEAIYTGPGTDDEKRRAKAEAMAAMRAEHERLKAERWGGFAGYDGWFARANNASLGMLATYNALAPAFERLFEREGRDFARFHAEVRRIAALPTAAERRSALP